MQRIGRVVKTEENGVMVSIERIAACRGCGACGRDIQSEVFFASGAANVGDVVRVERDEKRPAKPSPLIYPLYALGFAAGLVIAGRLGNGSEAGMILGGILGLALSAIALKLPAFRPAASAAPRARVVSVNDPKDVREIHEEGVCPKAAAWLSGVNDG